MVDLGGRSARLLMWQVGWVAIWAVASCGHPDDAPEDAAGADGPPRPPPQYSSCMDLASTCGPSGTSSCCEPAEVVPGGTFLRGYDAAIDAYNDMSYPATVSTFVLDRYEVTVGRFRKFVEAGLGTLASPPAAGAGAHPKLAGSGWDSAWDGHLVVDTAALNAAVKCSATYQTWTDSPGTNENKPMNCVSWYEAMAFCIWDGGYLPTEAEWNYAATGGGEQHAYPWSSPADSTVIDCLYANYFVNNPPDMHCVNGTTGAVNRAGSESPKGDGRWGHSDLAGNVWEWVLDAYVNPYPSPQTCNDCADLSHSVNRVLRGGSFASRASSLRTGLREVFSPTFRNDTIGWRCARTP